MKNLKLILTGAILTTIASCVNGDHYGVLESECATMTPTVEIVDLNGTATTTPQQWIGEDVLEAYAVSSDEGGNFYKSISMVGYDTAGNEYGFSIPVDQYNLYTQFEPGRKVYINLNELYFAIDDRTDALEIGTLYEGQVGRIAINRYEERIIRSCEKIDEEDLVITGLSITEAQDDQYLNRLIEFDGVQFAESSFGYTYFDADLNSFGGATNHDLTDVAGNSVILRVSEYATFAGDMIPEGSGKVRGVMTKYNDDYQFMIRTLNDVMLDNSRILPLFEETFETTTFPDWTAYNVDGAQVWNTTTFGNPGPSALMNGYSSGNQDNEDWLISPAIDLSSLNSALFSFETSTRFSGPALEVYISTDYDGSSAPNTATWVQVTSANLPVWSSGGYTPFTSSGGIDITSYTGSSNFRIAFKYNSTTSGAAAWEVDNVKIFGN